MSQWKPIAGAPKDTPVLLFCPTIIGPNAFRIGSWDEDLFSERPRAFWRYSSSMKARFMRMNPPSHFMALPGRPLDGLECLNARPVDKREVVEG